MDEISIEEARPKLGELVDRARLAGQATVITRHGKPAAVIVPVGWHEEAEARMGIHDWIKDAGSRT